MATTERISQSKVMVDLARWANKGDKIAKALVGLSNRLYIVNLTAAAEAADAIVVTGQLQDWDGTAVASAKQVLVRTLAVTADKGDITVVSGTSKKVVNPATGFNEAWVTTTAAGVFSVSVANDVAEDTLVEVLTEDGVVAMLKLTFA